MLRSLQSAARGSTRRLAAGTRSLHSTRGARARELELGDIRVGSRSSVAGVTATVFGASGFLGARVVNNLGMIGCRVVVPYRGDGHEIRHLKMAGDLGQIIPLKYSIRDQDSVERAVSKSDIVINCIGNRFETHNFSYNDTFVDSNRAIIQAANKVGASRYINVSSVNANASSDSGWLRANGEADALVRKEFPAATTIRVTKMWGELDQFITPLASMANVFPLNPIINEGQQMLQPVFVNDVGDAIAAALLKPETRGETYYLGGPETMTRKELHDAIDTECFVRQSNTVNVPFAVARAYGLALQQFRMMVPNMARLNEDEVIQQQYDIVVPTKYTTKTFEDLGLTRQEPLLGENLDVLCHTHRFGRAPAINSQKVRRQWGDIPEGMDVFARGEEIIQGRPEISLKLLGGNKTEDEWNEENWNNWDDSQQTESKN